MSVEFVATKTFDEIVSEFIAIHQTFKPDYVPNESDDILPTLQTFAYRELLLRTEMNVGWMNSYWMTATGAALDFCAEYFGLKRLLGAKPYTPFTFELFAPLSVPYRIPSGVILSSTDGVSAELIEDVVIPSGSTTGIGRVELSVYISMTTIKTEQIITPLPYLLGAVQSGDFVGGTDPESDEELRARIALAYERFSTAGAEGAYKFFAISADERIDDVAIYSTSDAVVHVSLHSLSGVDQMMIDRVDSALNADEVRPLTDHVLVAAAVAVNYTISGVVTIDPTFDTATVLAKVSENLNTMTQSVKIGESVSIPKITGAIMKVDGVIDMTLTAPVSNVAVPDKSKVAICTLMEVVNA